MADLNLPESAIPGLNWLFLVECITVVTLATFVSTTKIMEMTDIDAF